MRQTQRVILGWCVATLFSLLMETTNQAQTPEELYKRLEDSMVCKGGQPTSYDFSWVTPQIRAELIQYASTTSIGNLSKPQFITPREALLYLGESSTIKEQMNNYRKADGKENIWGPPDLLPYLVDDLIHASSENHVGVPGSYSLMDTSLLGSFEIIYQWTPFPAATRSWAGDTYRKIGLYYRLGPDSNANRLLRDWWKHNKEAILSRRYDQAAWLPPASEEVSDGPMASLPAVSSKSKPAQ